MTVIKYRAPKSLHNRGPILRITCGLRIACGQLLAALLMIVAAIDSAWAVNPESPEVRELIDKGLKFLESTNDERVGGKCLVALAFLKNGASHEHHRVKEALIACESQQAEQIRNDDVYSNGLAIIFLAELNSVKHRDLIERYAGVLASRQKQHGGWGYESSQTGDTSQTQYAILSYWQLMQVGMAPSVSSVEAGANWLLRTQDPSGGWGYQGVDPGDFDLKPQERTTLSMLSAGLGSTLICANVLGTIQPGEAPQDEATTQEKEAIPTALRAAEGSQMKRIRTLSGANLDRNRVVQAVGRGQKLFDETFSDFTNAEYPFYLLYSVERYKSFEEYLTGNVEEEPAWYQEGFKFAKERQGPEGYWTCPSGRPCATAFAILFLVRSTQKSIKAHLGEGTLVGGRGLSANLARMKLEKGRLVTERKPTEVDHLLSMLEETKGAELEALLNDSVAINVENLGPNEARRLEQLLRNGTPEARLLAVEALSKLRDLDYVPSLLYALSDPDARVVRAARDGLKYVSRRFDGYGPPDSFTETERYDALDKWKNWYRKVRPNSPVTP